MHRINPCKQFVGSFVPAWLEEREEVSLGAKLVYARLARCAAAVDGAASPTYRTLAVALGISCAAVRHYLGELEAVGLIEGVRRARQDGGEEERRGYFFLEHPWMGASEASPEAVAEEPGGEENADGENKTKAVDIPSPPSVSPLLSPLAPLNVPPSLPPHPPLIPPLISPLTPHSTSLLTPPTPLMLLDLGKGREVELEEISADSHLSAKTKKTKSALAEIPENFHLTAQMREYCRAKTGCADNAVLLEFDRFRNYHQAKGSRFRDWHAAWRTWVLNMVKYAKTAKPGEGPEDALQILRLQREREARENARRAAKDALYNATRLDADHPAHQGDPRVIAFHEQWDQPSNTFTKAPKPPAEPFFGETGRLV